MRNKKWLKSITAVAMSIVLLVTTVPIVLAVDTTPYDPAPIFSDASREQGAAAWLSDDGSVKVEFPAAEGAPTYQGYKNKTGEKKEIAAYILELHDLGRKLTAYNFDNNPLTITVDAANVAVSTSAPNTLSASFSKADIEKWIADYNKNADSGIKGIDLTSHRYSVTITAVDKDGWFSREMYAYVSDVPVFSLTDEEMMPMTANPNAMREMMCFEESKTNTQSSDGTTRHDTNVSDTKNIRVDYEEEGGTVSIKGKAEQAGAINAATDITTDTSAYRILITGKPGANGQTVDTGWSRQTFDYTGAKEIWFWMDLSQVDMQGISFRLRSNEKQWRDYGGGDGQKSTLYVYEADDYGTVYSTVGAKDKNPYVYVQQEDGSWKTVNMTNGTIDLAHFKGYVRVPIEFFCSESATYVQLTNDEMGKGPKFFSGNNNDTNRIKEWANQFYLKNADGSIANVLVDEAGKPISEAVLIQRRGSFFHKDNKVIGTKWFNVSWMKKGLQESENKDTDAYMIAPARGEIEIDNIDYAPTCADVEKQADGTYAVVRRENAYRAIQDVMSAGFAYTAISDDSVNKSVYLDNVMFYRDDGQQYPTNTLGNAPSQGVPVSNYFNQKEAIQEAIFNAIDEYIDTPNYSDYREVKYIANLINNYKRVYTEAGQYAATDGFLEYVKDTHAANYGAGALTETAAKLGRSATWKKYLDARRACLDEGTIQLETDSEGNVSVKNINNSDVNDLVPQMIQAMEKLPDPETVTQVSGTLRTEIVKLYRIYTRLNLGQLILLGTEEEARMIEYFNLVVNAIQGGFITGKRLANMPYILFNDFESATTDSSGRVYQLENDPSFSSDTDYAHTKALTTFSADNGEIGTKINFGSMYESDGLTRLPNASWATVTNNGFKNSKGLTTTISNARDAGLANSLIDNGSKGTWHAVTFSKNSKDAANYDEMTNNNMSAENLGQFKGLQSQAFEDSETEMPFSLIFYADFSQLSNFYFNVKIYTRDKDNNLVCARADMGVQKPTKWTKFFVLNQETGLWEVCHHPYRFAYQSNGQSGDTININNYKGYIMLPLYTFKTQSTTNSPDIMDDEKSLNGIYKIEFYVGSPDGLNDKSFTIDNVGFSYDPEANDPDKGKIYKDIYNSRTDKTYAEMFGAKSDVAEKFEEAVANIDPYDTANLSSAITAAENIYNELGAYQKTLQSVIQAKALLDKYKAGDIPAAAMTVDQLITEIGTISDKAKEVDTSASDLPNPGFDASGNVNYTAFGLTDKAEAEKIIKLYDETYKRISKTDKEKVTESEGLIKAYGAARRCLSLEDMKDQTINSFLTNLHEIYNNSTKDGKQTKYTAIADRDADAATWDDIYNGKMPYFAKALLATGKMGETLKAYQSASKGVPIFMSNCRTTAVNLGVTLNDGTTSTQGGVIQLQEKYEALYTKTKDKIDNKQTFSVAELQEITDAIGEYESLLPAYRDVVELYNAIEDIKALFPVHDISADKDTVVFSEENYSTAQTVTYTVNYTEMYPVPTADTELNKIRLTATNGNLTNAVPETAEYKIETTFGGVTETYTADQLKAGVELPVSNNAVNQTLTLKVIIPNKPTVSSEVTDTLTIDLIDKDGNIAKSRSGAVDANTGWKALEDVPSKTVQIRYTSADAYTITIPAEVSVPWNSADAQNVGYKVETSLAAGSSIAVSVADDGTNKLKVDGYSYTLPFTPENFAAKTFTGRTSKDMKAEADCPKLTISGWDSVPIGEYRTNLTYTVTYTKGTP